MRRYLLNLALVLFLSLGLNAQRGGRADAIQNYMRSMRPPNAELVLNVKTVHQKIYLHATDLRKMRRLTVRAPDPRTKATTTYEGVSLADLAPVTSTGPAVATLELSFGFYHKQTVSNADLDQESKPIIADTISGKRLTGYTPFCFVAKTKQGEIVLVRKVTGIKFKGEQQESGGRRTQ